MILFQKDWYRYPTAIVDTDCKNTSFIKLANIYKKLGLKNYYFHLALIDPRLKDIDPWSPNLTETEMAMVARETTINFWYFIRLIASQPSKGERMPFLANRANISMFWCLLNNCRYFLIQPRQTGKSFSIDTFVTWVLAFSENNNLILVTKDSILRGENIRRLRGLLADLPWYLSPLSKLDSNNSENITVKKRNNIYNSFISQSSEEAANKTARGGSNSFLVFDEFGFILHNRLAHSSAVATMNNEGPRAIREGRVSSIAYLTTAAKLDTEHGKYAYDMFNSFAEWREDYLDCIDKNDFEKQVRENSNPRSELEKANGIYGVSANFSHRQLGYTDEWLVEAAARTGGSKDEILRDFYGVFTSGSESSPWTTMQSQMIKSSEEEPLSRDIGTHGIVVNWYYDKTTLEQIMATRPVIAGLDGSNAIGKDSMTITFVDATNLEVIGTANINKINLFKYATWLANLMVRFNKILLVPENRSSAQGIIDYLIETLPAHGIDPFKRIFSTVVQEKESNPKRFENMDAHPSRMNIANQYRPNFGYTTTGSGRYSRDNLYNETLYQAIDIVADKIKDHRLINELLGLVIKDGRIDHQEGKHDDQVISWLLACWFIFNGRNVHYYDINRGRFLSNVVSAGEKLDPKKLMQMKEQEVLKEKIKILYDELSGTDDYFEFIKLEKQIKLLESRLSNENREQLSLSSAIDELKENRKMAIMKSSPNVINDILDGLGNLNNNSIYLPNNNIQLVDQYYQTTNKDIGSLDYWMN